LHPFRIYIKSIIRTSIGSLSELKRLYPSVNPFALGFDNDIFRLRFIPSENKILIRCKDVAQNGWFNVLDFWFIVAESLDFMELGLKIGFFSTGGDSDNKGNKLY
jgi:hypothetical protein